MKYIIAATILVIFVTGCTTRNVTNTPRTAIEQLLLSAAVDNAVAKFRVPRIVGKKTYLDFTNLKSYDAEYVKTAVRARFAQIGAVLVESTDQADYIAEITSGALGTEYKSSFLGIPSIPIPGSPTPLPELSVARGVEQTGIVKLYVFIHSNGKLITADHYYGKAERTEGFILWFRFQPTDDIRKAWEKADKKLEAESTKN
ncbi:MAG: DUF6655 family protein [Planctomycetota bacterium]|jgi:hypothetical protein